MDKKENQLIAQRKQKLSNIKKKGINPYPSKFDKKDNADGILKNNKKLKNKLFFKSH